MAGTIQDVCFSSLAGTPRTGGASVCAMCLFLIWGCSGGDSSPPTLPVAPPPPPPALAPAPAAGPATSAKPKPKPSAKPKPAIQDAPEPNEYVVGVPNPNFDAAVPPLRYGSAAYAAIIPSDGTDTNQFSISLPKRPEAQTTMNPRFVVPEGFTVVESAGYDEQGIPKRLRCGVDDSELVYVPGGTFLQGMDGQADEVGPQHPAYVDGFYMDVLEVTLAQYSRYQSATTGTRRPPNPVNPFDPPEYPALGVTWRDAQAYAKWAGKELPTEAEWERAGRGTEGFEYPWGNGRPIWDVDRRPGQVEPVGSHVQDRSIYGVMDLAGSAREWCADWYAADTYLQAKTPDGSPPRNPLGAERASVANARVVKGAGAAGWHLWARGFASMRDMEPDVGVRCVLRATLPAEPAAADATPP